MDRKELIKNMIDSIVNKNDGVKDIFHVFLQGKMKDVLHPTPVEKEVDTNQK